MILRNGMFRVWMILPLLCSCAAAQSLTERYQEVNPSVATIFTLESAPSPREQGQLTKYQTCGSGVLVHEDGRVVTAAHVVQTADKVFVQFMDGEKIVAKVVSSAPAADLALLQLPKVPECAKPVPLADSSKVQVGETVFVIGAPYGIGHTLTSGIMSARHRPNDVVKNFEMGEFFQTDAAVNQGNSGGPLFNMKGELIGIVSSILSQSGGFEGIGFAVTSDTARKLLFEEPTPWSGIQGYMLTDDLARAFNVPQRAGVLIERVAIGSLAYEAKLRGGAITAVIDGEMLILGGDIVLAVEEVQISPNPETIAEVRKAIRDIPVGEEINMKVLREGKIIELSTVRK